MNGIGCRTGTRKPSAQSLKAGVLGQGKLSEISSYGLFCTVFLPPEVSFLASTPGNSRNGREVRVLRMGKGREGLDRLEHLFLGVYGGFVQSELLGSP